jgi:type I restriction enzyme M protein
VSQPQGFEDKVAFVWRVADKLRGNFRPHENGQVMLPLLVLRRLDCVLEPTRDAVRKKDARLGDKPDAAKAPLLRQAAGQEFYNTSPLNFAGLLADDQNIHKTLMAYINAFSPNAQEVLEEYHFANTVERLHKAEILYQVVADFADLDLSPQVVSNEAMGYIFEELLRKFSEMSNETAGEHYTPREVIALMVDLLLHEDDEALTGQAPVRTVYDPAAGTGGMLTVAEQHIKAMNADATVEVYGQELNPETWAIARSELMIRGNRPDRMVLGNSLTQDGWKGHRFDYMLANPPYGVDWKAYSQPIQAEHKKLGFDGRFGAGLPRVSDGAFLFLQHMISKMKPVDDDPKTPWVDGGSRIGIVLSGSPLFSGAAGGGESEIRRWIIENDWLEGIVALPDQMYYNTGIGTYVWILTNRKREDRQGRVTLIDAREMGTKMRKSLGDKRKMLTTNAIAEINDLYARATELDSNLADNALADARVKVMRNEQFGLQRITVERPLRRRWIANEDTIAAVGSVKAVQNLTETNHALLMATLITLGDTPEVTEKAFIKRLDAELANADRAIPATVRKAIINACAVHDPDAPVITKKGKPEPDPDLRDAENVPLPTGFLDLDQDAQNKVLIETAEQYLRDEIHPYVPDAWIDHTKTKVGYTIPYSRIFFIAVEPRTIPRIQAHLSELAGKTTQLTEGLDPGTSRSGLAEVSLFSVCSQVRRQNRGGREQNLLSLSYGRIIRRDINSSEGLLPESFDAYTIVEEGDIVLRLTDLQNDQRSLRTGYVTERGIITSAYVVLRPNANVEGRFLSYCLYRIDVMKGFYGLGGGLRQSIGFDDIKRLPIPVLEFQEQVEIANHLDLQTAIVDELAESHKLQADLMREYKRSLVAAFVTGPVGQVSEQVMSS